MALVVETGSGQDANANSYISEADATAYLENSGRAAVGAWADLGITQRSGLLVLAAQYLTTRWNQKWLGRRVHEDQPLDWPRYNVWKRSGFAFSSSEIPVEVQRAQVEYAYIEASAPGSLFPNIAYDDTNRPLVSIREKVDVLEEERQFAETPITTTWRKFPAADGLIRHLVSTGGHLSRV